MWFVSAVVGHSVRRLYVSFREKVLYIFPIFSTLKAATIVSENNDVIVTLGKVCTPTVVMGQFCVAAIL